MHLDELLLCAKARPDHSDRRHDRREDGGPYERVYGAPSASGNQFLFVTYEGAPPITQMRVCVLALAKLMARSPAVPVHTEFGVTPENHDTRGILFKRSQTLRAHWSNA